MSKDDLNVDIAIAGGGVTGLALAKLVQQNTQLRIAIIETKPLSVVIQPNETEFDARSVALSAYSCEKLTDLGVAVSEIGCPIKEIHVSDKGHLGQCRLSASQYNLDMLGSVVELSRLQIELCKSLGLGNESLSKASKHSRLEWISPDQISRVNRSQDIIEMDLQSGKKVRAKLLVIAEGANSFTSQLLGFEAETTAYDQAAIVANIELQESHNFEAFERFTENGPLAMLPMPSSNSIHTEKQCSLVWTIDPSQQDELLALDDDVFLRRLQSAFGYRLGKFVGVSNRHCFPLALIKAEQSISHRTVLIGNASQMLHPIAGQGLNLALRDAIELSQILTGPQTSEDVGRYSVLQSYSDARKRDQKMLVTATDTLVRTFSNQYFPLVIARNLGLSILEQNSTLKGLLANAAMGFSSRTHLSNKDLS